jgi:adenosyl cobinamide kinase/adenosyl cobinamide phosphate guanylyltransferase
MHLIIGGKYMGKLKYAKTIYGEDVSICDLAAAKPEEMFGAHVVVNLQNGVQSLLKREPERESGKESGREEPARNFFRSNLHLMKNKVLIGDEIGSGIVPIDPFERLWRDETGFVYQILATQADRVDRVWAGLPYRLKG